MRPRIVIVVIAIAFLLILALVLTRRRRDPEPARAPKAPSTADPMRALRGKPLATGFGSSLETVPEKPDPAAARRALARGMASMSLHKADMWARHLEAMHGGASPEFRRFAKEFLAAAGEDAIPLVKTLLAECESGEAKFLLAAVLGELRNPKAIPVLKELIAQNPGLQTSASALYSIGMARTSEGYEYLTKWLESTRTAKWSDREFLLGPALAAIGQHGAQSVELMMAESVKRTGHQRPSKEDIVGMIRGEDALDGLRRILESEPDWDFKRGAIIALGSTADSKWLEYAAAHTSPAMTGLALLAARNLPDVWVATSESRTRLAERILTDAHVPSGNDDRDMGFLTVASLLPPTKARALYESVTATTEFKGDARIRIQAIIQAFADQPDIGVFVAKAARDAGIDSRDLQRSIEIAVEGASFPGKNVGAGPMVAKLLSVVKDSATQDGQVLFALRPAMRSGISEQSLSTALEEAWRQAPAVGPKHMLLGGVMQSAYYDSQWGSIHFTQPERFLATVLKEEGDYEVRLMAAYAYMISAESALTDPVAMRSISSIVEGGIVGRAEVVEVPHMLPTLMGTWYARHGGKEDIPGLQALPDQFAYPSNWNAGMRAGFRSNLTIELKRAIDAIRLSAN